MTSLTRHHIRSVEDEIRAYRVALEKIKSLLSYANQDAVSRAAAQSNINSAWWQAHTALQKESIS